MRLLICTQAVDQNDSVLGFFHRWIEVLAERYERVHVICLKEGEHDLPANVSVHSLGKESGRSLFKYISRFFGFAWSLRGEYDAVFVHMNEEYVLMAGLLWRMFGKRVVLWRNHKKGSWRTRLAGRLAHVVCYTSPEAHVARFPNAMKMPIGIDTAMFTPQRESSERSSILFLGRLDAVKRPDVFLEALAQLEKESVQFSADVYGDPTKGREEYARRLKETYGNNPGIRFFSSVRNDETPALYAAHEVYVNLTPSGSFDKTLGEALACGALVVAANDVLRGVIPDEFLVDVHDLSSVTRGIRAALEMDDTRREELSRRSRAYIEREHSLSLLVRKLAPILSK